MHRINHIFLCGKRRSEKNEQNTNVRWGAVSNKLKKTLPVILLLFLITVVTGITYAFITYTNQGNENTITTGNISMSYTESTNVITLNNELPKSDTEGKVQSEYFDFLVTSNLKANEGSPNVESNYEIVLEPLSIDDGYNALTNDQIKVYLEDVSTTSVLVEPVLISSLSASETNANNKALYIATHTHSSEVDSITTNYRLRAWIDYNVDSSSWTETNKYEYKFRININGVVEYKQATPEYCFEYTTDDTTMTASITDYYCYEGNTATQTSNIKDYFNEGYNILPIATYIADTKSYPVITDVIIPTTLGGYTVTKIQNGVSYAGAFSSRGLTSVVLPNTLQTIGDSAFLRNKNLTGDLVIPDSVQTIGSKAFYETALTGLTLGNSVQAIGSAAFYSNSNLTGGLVIPDSVTSIGTYAFSNNNLTSLTLGNSIQTIGEEAFMFNKNLTGNLVIPDSVTTIGDDAFYSNNLTSLTLGNSIETIGESAFNGNSNLTGKLVIPNSVITIGERAFQNTDLTSLILGNSVETIGDYAFLQNTNLSGELVIPNSVTSIGDHAFSDNNLTSLTIGENVQTIGPVAFYGNNLTSLTLGNSVQTIGTKAFYDNNLSKLTIPNNVISIGGGAFNKNNLLNEHAIIYGRTDDDSDGIAEIDYTVIVSSSGAQQDITIPDSVTTIGDYAFQSSNLTSIDIPDNVTTIGVYAFWENNLTSINIPDNVTTIGDYTFYKNKLTSINIPDNVTIIGKYAFEYNNLTSVVIPDSVTSIGTHAFSYNNIVNLIIPDSVQTIGDRAFEYNNLSYVIIGENSNLTETNGIGQYTFSTSTGITTYNGIRYVENPNLTKIYNNSGKKFKWYYVTQGRQNSASSTYNFITGTVPSYSSYHEVQIVEGYPE